MFLLMQPPEPLSKDLSLHYVVAMGELGPNTRREHVHS